MDCKQARSSFEELFDGDKSLHQIPGLKEHLEACPACQHWYAQERRVVDALEQLEMFSVPPDFTARVLAQLPDAVPEPQSSLAAQAAAILEWTQGAWGFIVGGLTRPGRRRRLVPILASAAAVLLLLGLLYALGGNEVTTTPGAATGSSPWAIGGGILVIAVVLLVALTLWRRKG